MGDSLGDRMKGYEACYRQSLPRRMPVILRVDGKAFHTFTKSMKRPFDEEFTNWMDMVAYDLCQEVQGARLAYTQSDEISVLIHGYSTLVSEPWFRNSTQKMCSVAASVASSTMTLCSGRKVAFDARVFVLPEEEVTNYFLWRQNDATRNSIQSLAQSLFSHKECHKKNCDELQEMCFQKGHNWNDLETKYKRGRCWVRLPVLGENREWQYDDAPPKWVNKDRDYVERFLEKEE